MKKIGIYKITSPTKKIYIGQSIDIDLRFRHYKYNDCKKQHILYRSLKKYGYENHKFEIIALCNENELNDLERYYQDLYCVTNDFGMNINLTKANDRSGKRSKLTPEDRQKISIATKNAMQCEKIKEKISNALKGRKLTQDHKNKISNKLKGLKKSEEHLQKIALAQRFKKRKPLSEEHKIKLSLIQKGKKGSKHTLESRKKISLAKLGKKRGQMSDIHKIKISIANKGRVVSADTRRKISETLKKRNIGN